MAISPLGRGRRNAERAGAGRNKDERFPCPDPFRMLSEPQDGWRNRPGGTGL